MCTQHRQVFITRNRKILPWFFAIAVVFHHLASATQSGILFHPFSLFGYLVVAFFFFLSGYGLQKSYINKPDSYKQRFLQKRIPSVLIPYVIITSIYWFAYFACGKFYSLTDILIKLINGDPIVSYSWYIINILIFYVAYWVLIIVCKNHHFLMILGGTIWYVLYAIFCIKMQYGYYWFNTSHLLIVGMFWATYESKIIELLKKFYLVLAPVIWITFIVLFLCKDMFSSLYISAVMTCTSAIFFVLSIIMFALKVQIGNKLLDYLGEISLEIYLTQGLFIDLFRGRFFNVENEILWCLSVLIGTIIIASILHVLFELILKKYRLLLHGSN